MDEEITPADVVAQIMNARTDEEWAATIARYGPMLFASPVFSRKFSEHIESADSAGRKDEAEHLYHWMIAAMDANPGGRLKRLLMKQQSDEELDRVIAENASEINARFVYGALNEVGRLFAVEGWAAASASHILKIALRLALHLGDRQLIIDTVMSRSMAAYQAGDLSAALADAMNAAELAKQAASQIQVGRCLSFAGTILAGSDRADEGLAMLLASVGPLQDAAASPETGPRANNILATTYIYIGDVYRQRGEETLQIENLQLAAPLLASAGRHDDARRTWSLLVYLLIARDEPGRALPAAEQLLGISASGDLGAEVAEFIWRAAVRECSEAAPEREFNLGQPYQRYLSEGKQQTARQWLAVGRQALALAPTGEGAALLEMAEASLALQAGDYARARVLAGQARDWFSARQRWRELRAALAALSLSAAAAGDMRTAAGYLDETLALPDNGPLDKSRALATQGQYLTAAGDLRAARRCLDAALDQAARLPDDSQARESEAATLTSIAALSIELGDADAAARAYSRAHKVAAGMGHRRGIAITLHGMGMLLGQANGGRFGVPGAEKAEALLSALDVGDPAEGAQATGAFLLEQAVAIFREVNDVDGWIAASNDLCNFLPADQAQRSLDILAEVLGVVRSRGRRYDEAFTLADIGVAYRILGDRARARESFTQSLQIARELGLALIGSKAAYDLGRLAELDGDHPEAIERYSESVQLTEKLRITLPVDDADRIGFGRDKDRPYMRLADLLVSAGRTDEAFEVVQHAKSRALLDLVGTTVLEPSMPPQGRFGELLAAEARHLTAASSATRARAGSQAAGLNMSALTRELDALYAEMTQYDPQYAAMRQGTPATVADLRAWLTRQPRPVLLVDYFLTGRVLLIFGLRADWEKPRVISRPCTSQELREGHADFSREVIRYRSAGGQSWARLSGLLTEPLLEWLRSGDLVCLVPHQILHALPLHALPASGSPLIIGHPVAYAPAAGVFPLVQNPAKGTGRISSCVAIGVVFEEEAEAVAGLFGTSPADTRGLTAERVAELCRGKDVCHLSCHGIFNGPDALSSGLLLNEAGTALLTARDVMTMRLDAELVCLSACCARSLKMRMKVSSTVSMCGCE